MGFSSRAACAAAMTEFHAGRIAAVFAAYPQLDVRPGLPAFFDGYLDQRPDSTLINGGEGILLDDLQFLVARQKVA